VSCKYDNKNAEKLAYNDILNGGCMKSRSDKLTCYNWYMNSDKAEPEYTVIDSKLGPVLEGHCRESRADMVFMFMVAVLLLATALMLFLRRRKGY